MNKNYYFLTAALLSFVFAVGHYIWGNENIIVKLQEHGVDNGLITLVFMGWNLAAMTTLLSGFAFFLIFTQFITSGVRTLAWFIVTINVGRYVVLLGTSLFSGFYSASTLIAQTAVLIFYLGVIFWGIQKDKKCQTDHLISSR
ncbi:MAG: hypothetical protein PHP42_04250 [Bacteroidota bacterium]|nr:hypothetical protein [Bacteroidota bacterium]